jgi:hypothetical protein
MTLWDSWDLTSHKSQSLMLSGKLPHHSSKSTNPPKACLAS